MAAQDASEHGPVVSATRARSGRWGKHVLWVLIVSTILAALVLMGAWGMRSGDLAALEGNQRADTAAEAVRGDTAPSAVLQTGEQGAPLESATQSTAR